jgi:hypothetical protein
VTPSPALNLTSSSKVLVTLMGNPGGTVAVQRVAVDTVNDRFTVYLTGSAGASTRFAWFVLD